VLIIYFEQYTVFRIPYWTGVEISTASSARSTPSKLRNKWPLVPGGIEVVPCLDRCDDVPILANAICCCLYTCTEPRSNTANLNFWNLHFWPLKLPFLNILLDQFAEHLDFSYSFHSVLLCHICHILSSCRRRRQFSWPPSGAVPIAALTSLRHRGVGRWGKAWSLDGTLK